MDINKYKKHIKDYFLPSFALIAVVLTKLYLVGVLEILYLRAREMPIYTESVALQWWQVFGMIVLDMAVGAIYTWAKHKGNGYDELEEDELEEDELEEDELEEDELEEDELEEDELEEDELEEDELEEDEKTKFGGDVLGRGFNYLWMSGVSSIIVTVIWTLVISIISIFIETAIIVNPTEFLTLYILFIGLRLIISGIIKSGVLAYTVHSGYYKSNILQALKFTTKNIFRLAWVEIVYIVKVIIGLILLVVGILATHPIAVGYKTERWGQLVRDYEREELYGKLNK